MEIFSYFLKPVKVSTNIVPLQHCISSAKTSNAEPFSYSPHVSRLSKRNAANPKGISLGETHSLALSLSRLSLRILKAWHTSAGDGVV